MLARELDPAARNGGEIVIAQPVQTVFDTVADERTEARYNPHVRNVELLTPEPLGIGTRFRAQAFTAGRPATMTIECTGYHRPHRFDTTTRMAAMDVDYTLTFEPVGDANQSRTRMRWVFDLHPHGALRLVRPVVAALGRRRERRNWTALRDYLEVDATRTGHRHEPARVVTRPPGNDADRGGPATAGPGLSRTERLALIVEYEGNKRLRRLGTALYRRSSGRIARRGRDVLLLTTRGRRSGREHTVLLQFFPDRDGLVVVAANSGRRALPDWYRNLMAGPPSTVEVGGRRRRVRPVEIGADEAAVIWPRILRRAPPMTATSARPGAPSRWFGSHRRSRGLRLTGGRRKHIRSQTGRSAIGHGGPVGQWRCSSGPLRSTLLPQAAAAVRTGRAAGPGPRGSGVA